MTDEQIKQNAENIVQKLSVSDEVVMYSRSNMITAAILGIHSRDEEIEELKHEVIINSHLRASCQEEVKELQKQFEKFRNPWVSLEERLPEEGAIVFTRSVVKTEGGGVSFEEEQFLVQPFAGEWISDNHAQHKLRDVEFNTIHKVTHWMPIPKIEKGE